VAANLQAATSHRYERHLLDDPLPVTINDGDRERLATLGVEAYTIPLAVDLPPEDEIWERSSTLRHDVAVRLLFIGSFVHPPNRDAAKWLVRRLAPELRTERVPFALVIAGLHAPTWLRKAGGAGVTIISDAPDLDPLYRGADIVLAPLPHGGGTKNKTLEAMAWGLPVIGTPQAFTGLPQLDGEAFVVDPLDALRVANRIAVLRDDPELRLRLGLAGRRYVAASHGPALATERAIALFDAVAAGGGVAQAESLARAAREAREQAQEPVSRPDGQGGEPASWAPASSSTDTCWAPARPATRPTCAGCSPGSRSSDGENWWPSPTAVWTSARTN
jgi:hypothetical protein